jgi:ABC-2 type transport system permease protein
MLMLTLDLLRSRRTLVLAICGGLLFTAIGYLALFPSLEDQLLTMAEDLPDTYKAFIGDTDIASAEGYIRSQVYSLLAPLLVAGAAISAGASLARAERDQTLVVYAVQPLSRRALAGSWFTLVALVAVIGGLASFIGVVIGAPLAGADVGIDRILLATLPMLMFGMLVGSIALLVSTLTGSPGMATSAGWLTILVSFLANSLAELIDGLRWLARVNPWSWHGAGEALTDDFNAANFGLLVLAVIVVGGAAIAAFERRDLHL